MTTTTASRPWTPTNQDRIIYRWVKFDGHKQSWVAEQLEMHQSTVSRIIDRYERWVAHGGPAQEGALTRDERLRAQVWLTYERNEWIITSALRLAGEMERAIDTSKSTTMYPRSSPSREVEVRTENSVLDRSGIANRYLRLAHRVGLDQLQLLKQYDLPALEPLLLDEHEYSQTLADIQPKYVEVPPAEPTASPSPPPDSTTHHSPAPPMHTVHKPTPPESPLTPAHTITSVEISPDKKPTLHAYDLPQNPPETTEPLGPILDATIHQQPPPIRILPFQIPSAAP
jgi:hypothetical protein